MRRNNALVNLVDAGGKKIEEMEHDEDEELLFDLEVFQAGRRRVSSSAGSDASWGSSASYADIVGEASGSQVSQEVESACCHAWASLQKKGTATLASLAKLLAHILGRATIRTGLGAENALASMSQLRHSFILCKHVHGSGTELVVDPYFRDQFILARRDEEYNSFMATVPQLFVGTREMLRASIRVVSDLMSQAMKRVELSPPPWRDVHALLSKWDPSHYRDAHYLGTLPASATVGGGANVLAAMQAAMRHQGDAPAVPAAITVCNARQDTTGGQKHAQALPPQQQQQAANVSLNGQGTRAPVVIRGDAAQPKAVVVGFHTRGGCRGLTHNALKGDGAPVGSSSGTVSSLSEEWALAELVERKARRKQQQKVEEKGEQKDEDKEAGKGAVTESHTSASGSGPPLPPPYVAAAPHRKLDGGGRPRFQQRQQEQQEAVAARKVEDGWAGGVAAIAAGAGRMQAIGGQHYRSLDQLLPVVRTVRLGCA